MKILLIKYRNIGDVLLVTPLVNNLKLFYPTAQIDIALNHGTEEMVTLNPNIFRVLVYDREYIKSQNFLRRIKEECKFFLSYRNSNYEIVINLTEGDRGALIAKLTNAPIRIGHRSKNWYLRNAYTQVLPKQNFRHTIESNLDPLKNLGIPVDNKKVSIYWSDTDDEFINKKLLNIDHFIHIHPVSRWMFKCIDDKTMAKIIDYCELELGYKVILTGDSNRYEINKIKSIMMHCFSKPKNLCGKLTLKQTAALNKRARFFIGVDTAIMHMSAANDIPVFAFFGPSGADHWGPWDNYLENSGYIKRNGVQRMGRHIVFSEQRICQPCGNDGCDGTKISDCIMNMDLELIKKHIREIIVAKTI